VGRYYTVVGNSLYVYTTRGESLIEFSSFPDGVGVFGAEVAWRLCPWLGFSEGATQTGLKVVGLILDTEGYVKVNVPQSSLEEYFIKGDDRVVEALAMATLETEVPQQQSTLDVRPAIALRRFVRRRTVRPASLRDLRVGRGGS